MTSAGNSVSRVPIEIEIIGKGAMACELTRHTAPLTCSALLKNLPFENLAHNLKGDFVYVESKLIIGSEKPRSAFKQGELGYLTSNGAVCIFLRDSTAHKMNLIGRVTKNLELARSIEPGDSIIVRPA